MAWRFHNERKVKMKKKFEGVIVKKSEFDDTFKLAPYLRKDDLRELKVFNLSGIQGLLRGYIWSDECFTARYKGKIICMFGVTGHFVPKGFGSIWFLGSDEMKHHALTFLKHGRRFIKRFLKRYDILINAVDKRNTTHINWIKKAGLTIAEPVFINGYEFLQFYASSKSYQHKRKEK